MKGLDLFKRPSISRRLVGFSLVFVTATVIVASVILYLIVAGVVREQIDQRLDTQIEGLRGALFVDANGMLAVRTSLNGPPFDRRGAGWYWQVSEGQVRIASRSLAGQSIDSPPRPLDWRHVLSGVPQPTDHMPFQGEQLYLRVASANVDGKTVEIAVTAPQSALTAPARRALLWLIPAMTLLGIVLVAGILLQVRYGLRPLRQLTSSVSEIRAGNLSRLPEVDVGELSSVTEEINRLVEQNQQRLADTRLHFANLAHGLKTPVTSLSLALNPANDPDGEMRNLVDRIDRRIRHHLARARKTAAGGTGLRTAIKFRIDDLLLVLMRIYSDRGITVRCDMDPETFVACAEDDVDEILGNLIDNAFKWATGAVDISATTEGSTVAIIVEDDGPGIAPMTISDAFLPGKRLDETVPGDGFGLAIAGELTQLYGGSIHLSKTVAGGLRCLVSLPRALPPSTWVEPL
ncbi:sensor histidine kinase [Rhizobium esperanzae]|uniref:histidine kinase n=1 Tax=Rhizobium esperanzae TaxID=1967781 RepID=A0A7W6R4D1_9HYPH|nr:sensor histidine kinase [Rhizobium esperanzae]MBB4236629.1 signal transduction histidine kinase [Rhizobium esperanzae]